MDTSFHFQKYQKYKQRYYQSFGGGGRRKSRFLLNKPNYPKPGQHDITVAGCRKTMFFFDNDAHNFSDRGRCMCVIPVEIGESVPLSSVGGLPVFTDETTYQEYLQTLSKGARAYGRYVAQQKTLDSYDPQSGLRTKDIYYYVKMLKQPHFRERVGAFIFDWDRTLTVFEGVPAGYGRVNNLLQNAREKGLSSSVRTSDVAEYYFGGTKRAQALRLLFQSINEFQIPIYVLSANRGVENYRAFFNDLLTSLGLVVPSTHLIYRGRLTKYQYIEEALPDLCQGNPKR